MDVTIFEKFASLNLPNAIIIWVNATEAILGAIHRTENLCVGALCIQSVDYLTP